MAANLWKNGLKDVESDNSKMLYKTLLGFFLQRNGTYFLNTPLKYVVNILGVAGHILLTLVLTYYAVVQVFYC